MSIAEVPGRGASTSDKGIGAIGRGEDECIGLLWAPTVEKGIGGY